MLLLPIISIILWVSYIIFVLCKFGIPTTISETYYLLSKKWDWIFAVWFFVTSTPLCIYWFIIAPHGLKWFPIANWVAMVTIGLCGCYKSGPKDPESVKCISKGDETPADGTPTFQTGTLADRLFQTARRQIQTPKPIQVRMEAAGTLHKCLRCHRA